MASSSKSGFNWESVKAIGITPQSQAIPSPTQIKIPKTAVKIFVGETPITQPNSMLLKIDGMEIVLGNNPSFKFTMSANNNLNLLPKNDKVLNLKLDNDDFSLIDLSGICNDKEILLLKKWIAKDETKLLRAANEYEQHGRQFYHFLYDMISLIKCVNVLPRDYYDKLVSSVDDGTRLMHNRIQAEVICAYCDAGNKVEIDPPTASKGNPDLSIDGKVSDVKTILVSAQNNQDSCIEFAAKLRYDIMEKDKIKGQVGNGGIFFIAPFSGILNSILLVFFNEMKMAANDYVNVSFHTQIPPVEANKTIFVLSSPNSFENCYLVFDTDLVCEMIDAFAIDGYPQIRVHEPLSYLTRTNIRKGCPLGIMSPTPSFMFRIL
jgi:hypothetical protein